MSKPIDEAVILVRRAVDQDSKKNYIEAAKSYREAIKIFHDVARSPSAPDRLKEVIESKVSQYESRLRNLDKHIIGQTDLSQLFQEVQQSQGNIEPVSKAFKNNEGAVKPSVLSKALGLIREGIYADESRNYGKALALYEMGLSNLKDVIERGMLPSGQEKLALMKYQVYHDRKDLLKGNIISKSRKENCDNITKKIGNNHVVRQQDQNEIDINDYIEAQELDDDYCTNMISKHAKSHSNITKFTEKEAGKTRSLSASFHSLYPTCEIRETASDLTLNSGVSPHSTVRINKNTEYNLSSLSLEKAKLSDNPNKASQTDINDDTKSQSSDSGYSDENTEESFSINTSDDEDDKIPTINNIEPNIIIVNEYIEDGCSQPLPPDWHHHKLDRQTSLFQNPSKDILISHESRDNLAVLEHDETDLAVNMEPRTSLSFDKVSDIVVPEVYMKREKRSSREYIPPRAVAKPRGEHEGMNKGCYYLMAALDFCWCL